MKISDLEYRGRDGERYVGYLAMPDHPDGPAVLVAHNAPGVSEFERTVAQRLAGLGYVVLCADYIGDGEVLAMDAIGPRLGGAIADTTLLRDAITAGLSALIAQPGVDAGRVAAIGYCLGGAAVLELARGGGGGDRLSFKPSGDASGGQQEHQRQDPDPDGSRRSDGAA